MVIKIGFVLIAIFLAFGFSVFGPVFFSTYLSEHNAYGASFAIDPHAGSTGTFVHFTASGLGDCYGGPGGATCNFIYYDGDGNTGIKLAHYFVSGGMADTIFVIPCSSEPGSHTVFTTALADDGETHVTWTDNFVVTEPEASISPAAGPAGTEVSITGSGFPPSQQMGVTYDGQYFILPAAEADSSGNLDYQFIAPGGLGDHIIIIVTGCKGVSKTFTVTEGSLNEAPTANAGSDQVASPGGSVGLQGSGSDSDGTIESYAWSQTAGPSVTLSSTDVANPTFTAPNISADKNLSFQLVVTDDKGASSDPASVDVWVSSGNPVGTITEIVGNVELVHPDNSRTKLELNSPIHMGDVIETSESGGLHILFADNTEWAVSEGTRLTVDEYVFDPDNLHGISFFSMLQGMFVYISGQIGENDPDGVNYQSPGSAGGIRGTEFIWKIDPLTEIEEFHLILGKLAITPKLTDTTTEFNAPITIVFDKSGILYTLPLLQEDYDSLKAQILSPLTPLGITTPPAILVNTDPNGCISTNPNIGTASSAGGFPPVSISDDRPNQFQLGDTTVTWTATDSATPTHQTASATQTVTVLDNQNPTITAPPDMTVDQNVIGGWTGSIGTATSSDNCPGVSSPSNDAPAIFPPGTTTVTWTTTDGASRQSTATQHITVNVQPDNTALTLNRISNVAWGKSVIVTGTLKDSTTNKAIAGATVTFTGSGSSGLPATATTNSKGAFTASGLSPNSVGSWQVIAHYSGDSIHKPADSNTGSYSTSKHKAALTFSISPSSVPSGQTYGVLGNLADADAGGAPIGFATVTFTAKSPIVIPSTSTDSSGNYQVNNLIAPAKGKYSMHSSFAGNSLYNSVSSTSKTLTVT